MTEYIENTQYETLSHFEDDIAIILPKSIEEDNNQEWRLPNLSKLYCLNGLIIYDYLELKKIQEYVNRGQMVGHASYSDESRSKAEKLYKKNFENIDEYADIPIIILIRHNVGGSWSSAMNKLYNKGYIVVKIGRIIPSTSHVPPTPIGEIGKELIVNRYKLLEYLRQ